MYLSQYVTIRLIHHHEFLHVSLQTTFCSLAAADKKSYALSIRDFDSGKNDVIIKHYRIRKMDDGGCYISPKRAFPTIIELIDHYKSMCKYS